MIRSSDLLIPVLKSNAYGHGLREVSQAVAMIKTVSMVAVDNYPETQQILYYTKLDVLMMGEAHVERYRYVDHRRVHVAVYTHQIVTELVRLDKPFCIHLFLNTGLNREGIQEADLAHILSLIRGSSLIVEGVMSHFACDDEVDGEAASLEQIAVFKRMYAVVESYGHTPQYRHINNTSGIIRFADPWFNAHRLGKGLYWYTSQRLEKTKEVKEGAKAENVSIELQMVADVYSTVISTQQIQAWQWVGYGYQRVAHENSQTITIPFGYAEGLTRAMTGQWNVRVGALVLPLIGAISMNYSSAQTANKDKKNKWEEDSKEHWWVKHGDIVHVISSNSKHANNWHEMARINHTITRELLIKMDEKMRRIVI